MAVLQALKVLIVFVLPIWSFPRGTKENLSETCLTPGCIHAASQTLKYLNTSVNPCENFYEFACGGFISSIRIPADQSKVTSYTRIWDIVQERLKAIAAEKPKPDDLKAFAQVKKLYRLCVNRNVLRRRGLFIVRHILNDLGEWPVVNVNWTEKYDWKQLVHKIRKWGFSGNYIVKSYIGIHPKNSSRRIISIDEADLGLSQRYLTQGLDQKVVKAYYDYMVNVSVIFGANRSIAEEEMKKTLEFEMKLAEISLPPEKRRILKDLYHPMTIHELQKNYPLLQWKEYIENMLRVSIGDEEIVVVKVPQYLSKLEQVLQQTPEKIKTNYLIWRLVKGSIPYLNDKMLDQKFEFDKSYSGVSERKHRSKECVQRIFYKMDIAMGALYARRHFTKGARDKVTEMVSDIHAEFVNILQGVDWMDDETRQNALKKARAMKVYMGYPDEMLDDAEINKYYEKLELSSDDFLLSILNVTAFERKRTVERFRMPVNKTEWTAKASPAVVNAFYDLTENGIEFPAGILQGVYFESTRPNYMNYGAIGSVIGHEITHGFDDKGRQHDEDGNLNDWWAEETSSAFTTKARCIIEQYSNLAIPEIGANINGIYTQGENIADNGGIKEAYLAYQEWVRRNGEELKLPGLQYTPNQVFWIAAAAPYCSKARPESLKNTVLTSSHAPDMFRINIPFSNNEHFAKDFHCSLGSPMNPQHKCHLW